MKKHEQSRIAVRPSEPAMIAPGSLHDQAIAVRPPGMVPNPPADSTPASTPPAPATVVGGPNDPADAGGDPSTSILQVETGAHRGRHGRSDEAMLPAPAPSAAPPEADANPSVPAAGQVAEHDRHGRAGGPIERNVQSESLESVAEGSPPDVPPASDAPAGSPRQASTSERPEIHSESTRGEHRSVLPPPKSSREPELTRGSAGNSQRAALAPSVSNGIPSGSVARPSEPYSATASGHAAPRQASGPPSDPREAATRQELGPTPASGDGPVPTARLAYDGRDAMAPQPGRAPAGPTAEPHRVVRERDAESGAPPGARLVEPPTPGWSQPEKQAAGRGEPPRQPPAARPPPQRSPTARAGSVKADARPEPTAIRAGAVQHTAAPRQSGRLQTISPAPKTPEVKIGQVDVFFEAPRRAERRGASQGRPSVSLASRFYLRRL